MMAQVITGTQLATTDTHTHAHIGLVLCYYQFKHTQWRDTQTRLRGLRDNKIIEKTETAQLCERCVSNL